MVTSQSSKHPRSMYTKRKPTGGRRFSKVLHVGLGCLAFAGVSMGMVLLDDFHEANRAKAAGFASIEEKNQALRIGCVSIACVKTHEADQVQLAQQRVASVARLAQERAQAAQQRIDKAAACQRDIACRGREHIVEASVYCKPAIERRAKYDYKWEDSWLRPTFSSVRAGPGKQIIYSGDKLKFQNGFGAWQYIHYTCTFNPQNNTVSAVYVKARGIR